MPPEGPYDLPHLRELFDGLRRGRHLCREDGGPFRALVEREEDFRALFAALGYQLERHPKDFFYFRGEEGGLSDRAERMALFVFILVEHLAERREAVEELLFAQRFRLAELPHWQGERHRAYLQEAGLREEADLEAILKQMERLGFVDLAGDGFRFRTPSHRLFELCRRLADAPAGGEDTRAQQSEAAP